jgi:hypothetical protein
VIALSTYRAPREHHHPEQVFCQSQKDFTLALRSACNRDASGLPSVHWTICFGISVQQLGKKLPEVFGFLRNLFPHESATINRTSSFESATSKTMTDKIIWGTRIAMMASLIVCIGAVKRTRDIG